MADPDPGAGPLDVWRTTGSPWTTCPCAGATLNLMWSASRDTSADATGRPVPGGGSVSTGTFQPSGMNELLVFVDLSRAAQ